MRRCASCTKTIAATSTIDDDGEQQEADDRRARPVSTLRPSSVGMPATMPPKMISEMPLPMPFSVISSPSQTRNIVPAIIEMIAANVGERRAAGEADVA